MRRFFRLLIGLTLLGVLPGCVEDYFFYPDRIQYSRPADFGLGFRDVALAARDGSRLHGWWLPAQGQPAKGVVVHLHGNAANISNHLPFVAWLPPAGYHVLTIDYRGYGDSQGVPSLDGLVEDALAALTYAAAQPESEGLPIYVIGQSLGGATAIRALAQTFPAHARVCALVADSAFAGYRQIAQEASRQSAWLSGLASLGKYDLPGAEQDPERAIGRIGVPVLLLHGKNDVVVPFHHAGQLLAAAAEPKALVTIEGGAHVDGLTRPPVQSRVLAFLAASQGCALR